MAIHITTQEDWVMEIRVNGELYRVIWLDYQRFTKDQKVSEHHLEVRNNTNEEVPHTVASALKSAARSFRWEELRTEYAVDKLNNEVQFFDPFAYKVKVKELIVKLAQRSWAGDWIGQSIAELIYAQDLKELLRVDSNEFYDWIYELVEEELIGLNGMILIEPELMAANYLMMERKFGHKRLEFGDTTIWSCAACGAGGDADHDGSPASVPCVKTPADKG